MFLFQRIKLAEIPNYFSCLLSWQFFFTSFLSRDEAFKIINDGWFQHSGVKLVADQQVLFSI